jgi:hypothetical protein
VKVGGHPIKSVSHGLWKEKVGRSDKLYKRPPKYQSLFQKLDFFMEDSKNPIASRWQRQPPLKTNFYLYVLQMKISSTCLITASLCERPFFYFYVEAPPSNFMYHLREHSCHSEFNVHSPKVIIDWFMITVLLVLKLFISSLPLKLEGVLCISVLLFHEGQAENHFDMFFYMIWTHIWLSMFHYSWSFVCVTFHIITWLPSFIVKIMSLMPMF